MRLWLASSSGAVLIFVGAWIVLLAATAPKGSLGEQLERLRRSSAAYRWSFVNASLIAPAMLITLSLLFQVPDREPGRLDAAGTWFLAAYAALVSVAYTTQYTVLPQLLLSHHAATELVYFGAPGSITYLLAMLAYALFGAGAILLATPLITTGGAWSWAGWFLLASGITSILGFAGYVARNRRIELLNVVGGVLVVPFAVAVLVGGLGI